MTPATKDFEAFIGTVFGPYILVFNQQKALNLGAVTVNVGSNAFTRVAHGLLDGDQVRFTTTDRLPTPLEVSQYYFVRDATTDTFKIALTAGGGAVDILDEGSGTHTLWKRGIPLNLTGWNVRAWARHVEDWDASVFIDLAPTIIDGPNGRVQILVDDSVTSTWKNGDHRMSVLLQNTSLDWLGPYLIGKLTVRKSASSGTVPA
jgi:hypothetical protein